MDSEVVEKFGGPSYISGRTYGPLIKSVERGVAQVLDGMSNPRSTSADPVFFCSSQGFRFPSISLTFSLCLTPN